MNNNCTELWSDHFHIIYDADEVVIDLRPDSSNPDMNNYKPSDYVKLFILDEMELFRKENNIPKFLWKKHGMIVKPAPGFDYYPFVFHYHFLWKTVIKKIKISTSLLMFLH